MNDKKTIHKPRIGMVHYTLPPAISGVEIVIRDHARLLSSSGYKVFLLGASGKKFRSEIEVHLSKSIDPKNKQVILVQEALKKGKIVKEFSELKKRYYVILKRWVEKNKIDIVLVHNIISRHYNLALTAAIVELANDLKNQVKFVSWVHDASFIDIFYTKVDQALKSVYPWNLIAEYQPIFTYVTVSETRKKELEAMYSTSSVITVIPNGLDINKMLPLPSQTRMVFKDLLERNPDYLGLIPVRIAARKNIEYAIQFARTAKDVCNVNFLFLITGALHMQSTEGIEYYNFLKAEIERLNVEANFLFLYNYRLRNGEKFDTQKLRIRDLYLISDFLFLPSKSEGFGLPIIEAGFMRVPIFVSNLPIFKEIGNGYINTFDLNAPTEESVKALINELQLRKSTLYHKIIVKEYSLEKTVKNKIIPLLTTLSE